MSSLLDHENHITKELKSEPLEVHHAFNLPPPDDLIKPYIERSGFADVLSIGAFKINPSLITAMVERWRPETHTFHLPVGECTITLQDVAMQLGLPVDGHAVTASCQRNWDDVCVELLGRKIPKTEGRVGNQIKFTWLQREFNKVPEGASSRERKQYFRAYLLLLIGGVILPDKTSNRVNIKYLLLLKDIDKIKDFSWGSACLTNLYRMLCRTASGNDSCMGGCTILLQSWFWYRLPFLAPRGALPNGWPLAKRWVGTRLNHTQCPRSLASYREEIDRMTSNHFAWLPYYGFNEEPKAYMHSTIWTTNTAMVCFHMVEWHHADRVMLQFGLVQEKPKKPVDMSDMHKITMQGQADLDWEVYHGPSIELWNDRLNRCVVGRPCYGQPVHSEQYMRWFLRKSRPFLSQDHHLRDPRNILPVGVVDEEDEEQVPPPVTTQRERKERNRARRQRPAQTQDTNQTFQGTQQYGQSSSHTPFQTPFQYPYGQSSSHTPFQETPQSFQQTEDYVPHRHSTSHIEPFTHPFNEHTPLQDPHRHSTSEWNTNQDTDWLGFQIGSQECYSHLAFLQQQLPDSSSSTVPQFLREQPPPPPTEAEPTEEEHRPPNRRSRRVPKPKGCGTGGHLHH